MTTIVHQKQTMLPQYGRFQMLQTHVLQVMDKGKKMMLTREMMSTVLTLVIPNRVFVVEKGTSEADYLIRTDVIDVETGEVFSDNDLFGTDLSINEKKQSGPDFCIFEDNDLVIRCADSDNKHFKFNMKPLHCPMMTLKNFDACVNTKQTKIPRRFSIERMGDSGILGITPFARIPLELNHTLVLLMHQTNIDGVKPSYKKIILASYTVAPAYPRYLNCAMLRNNMILFDIGHAFILFDHEQEEVLLGVNKPNDIPRFNSSIIQLLNGLIAVVGGHHIEFRDDNTTTVKYMSEILLYDPVTLQVVNSKTFDDPLLLLTGVPVLLHDGRVMLIGSHLGQGYIIQPIIFDPEDMSITNYSNLYMTKPSNVKWITMAHLIPFSPF